MLNQILSLFSKLKTKLFPPQKTLCTVTFIYDLKGVIGSGKDKTETIFAWVENGTSTYDCIELFKEGIENRANYTIRNVIVLPIKTVKCSK